MCQFILEYKNREASKWCITQVKDVFRMFSYFMYNFRGLIDFDKQEIKLPFETGDGIFVTSAGGPTHGVKQY